MHRAEREVAVRFRAGDDAEGVEIRHLVEGQVLLVHPLVDAVRRDLAPADAAFDAGVFHLAAQRGEDVLDHRLAVAGVAAQVLGDRPVAPRIEIGEADLLQLVLQVVHAEAVGDRRVDLERFARDASARLVRHAAQRAHVVQAVGKLDEHHAQVARHRQHQLAEALRVGLDAGAELHLVQLGDALDQVGDLAPERLLDIVPAERGVLDRVVQDGRRDALVIHAQVGEDRGDRDGVVDVGFAGLARLAAVGFLCDLVGPHDEGDLLRLEVAGEPLR